MDMNEHLASLESAAYEGARADLKRQFKSQFAKMDVVYSAAASMFKARGVKITKPRGLSHGTVTVIFLLLTKACKTFRAIRATCLEGCGQDAGILVRGLFETTLAVLWILQRNSRHRAVLFAAHQDQRLLVMVQEGARTPGLKRRRKQYLKAAQARMDDWLTFLDADALSSTRRHWSGERGGLEAVAQKLKGCRVAYNSVYRMTSTFAHGSDPTQHAQFYERGARGPVYKLLPGDAEVERCIVVSCVLLYAIVKRMNDRMGLGLEDTLVAMKQQVPELMRKNSHKSVTST